MRFGEGLDEHFALLAQLKCLTDDRPHSFEIVFEDGAGVVAFETVGDFLGERIHRAQYAPSGAECENI